MPPLEESLKLYKELGPAGRRGVAYALWGLGTAASYQGNSARSKALTEESLALFRELGDKFGITESLNTLGDIALTDGDYEQARILWEESLALKRERGDKDGIAFSLAQLGNIAFLEGDFERATPLYEEAASLVNRSSRVKLASRPASVVRSPIWMLGCTATTLMDRPDADEKSSVAPQAWTVTRMRRAAAASLRSCLRQKAARAALPNATRNVTPCSPTRIAV